MKNEVKTWDKYKKKELLEFPKRRWGSESVYDSVLFVNTKEKHDSGYNVFTIIGVNDFVPVEIAGYMDDFRIYPMEECKGKYMPNFAFDCSMGGVIRMHCWDYRIKVCQNFSTTYFKFVKEKG